jgi:hypothetical protein
MDLSKLFTMKTVKSIELGSRAIEKGAEPFLAQTTSSLTEIRPKEPEMKTSKGSTSSKDASEKILEKHIPPPTSSEQTQSEDINLQRRKRKKGGKTTEPRKSPGLESSNAAVVTKEPHIQGERSGTPPPLSGNESG